MPITRCRVLAIVPATIWVPQFPAMQRALHLVLRLKGKRTEVGEHQVQIKLSMKTGRAAGGSGR